MVAQAIPAFWQGWNDAAGHNGCFANPHEIHGEDWLAYNRGYAARKLQRLHGHEPQNAFFRRAA